MVSYVPESVLLWTFPQGQMFNIFKEVCRLILHRCDSHGAITDLQPESEATYPQSHVKELGSQPKPKFTIPAYLE